MKLSIASGKGGTGKTSLACALARALGSGAALLDCDVEEPDCALFLKPEIESETEFSVPVPLIDSAKCKGHGRCQEVCEYNAIKLFNGKPFLFDHMCHSCGGCAPACPEKASAGFGFGLLGRIPFDPLVVKTLLNRKTLGETGPGPAAGAVGKAWKILRSELEK